MACIPFLEAGLAQSLRASLAAMDTAGPELGAMLERAAREKVLAETHRKETDLRRVAAPVFVSTAATAPPGAQRIRGGWPA